MNGMVKVPMQFLILLVGALVFAFYQFHSAPLFFNQSQLSKVESSVYKDSLAQTQQEYQTINLLKQKSVTDFSLALHRGDKINIERHQRELTDLQHYSDSLRGKVKTWISTTGGDNNDTNYIFIRFVVDYLPAGLVGLLIAIIFLASWGSIAAALNSLSSSTMVDFHRRFSKHEITPEKEYQWSKWYTLVWGIFCIIVAMFTYNIGNSLIEAVNVLGSLFYGVILGVFLVAFFFKNIKSGLAVFWGAVLAECLVLTVFIFAKLGYYKLGFLWLNPIGVFGVILFTLFFNVFFRSQKSK
jgi:solute:Na+ symporter, SSS family